MLFSISFLQTIAFTMHVEIAQGLEDPAVADVLADCFRIQSLGLGPAAAKERSPRHELIRTTEHVLPAGGGQ